MVKRAIVNCVLILFLAAVAFGGARPELAGKIAVGKEILSAVFDGKTKRLYLLTDSDTLEVIDCKERTVKGKVELKTRLSGSMGGNGLSFDTVNEMLYFPSGDKGNEITEYDIKSGKVMKTIGDKRGDMGYASGIAVDQETGTIVKVDWAGYVASYDKKGILKNEFSLDMTGHKYFAMSPDGLNLYVSGGNHELLVVSVRGKQVEKRLTGLDVRSVPFIEPDSGNVIIAGASAVSRIDKEFKISKVPLKAATAYRAMLALNLKTGHLFVPLEDGSVEVLKLEAEEMKSVANIRVGASPKVAVVDQDEGVVYVTTREGIAIIRDAAI